jgi:hypothetical protein
MSEGELLRLVSLCLEGIRELCARSLEDADAALEQLIEVLDEWAEGEDPESIRRELLTIAAALEPELGHPCAQMGAHA